MVTSLATGDKIHFGDSVTLTLLAIEDNLVCFKIESSAPDDHDLRVHIEGSPEPGRNWWESN